MGYDGDALLDFVHVRYVTRQRMIILDPYILRLEFGKSTRLHELTDEV